MTWSDIAKLFERIELLLIRSLKRNLSGHKAWERAEGFDWPAWQAEKLRNLKHYRRQNDMIMAEYVEQIDAETEEMLQEQFAEGIESVNNDYEAITRGKPAAVTERSFFGVNRQRVDSLIQDIQTVEKRTEQAALRMMDDVYRKTVHQAQMAMATGTVTLPKAIDMATQDFLSAGINCIEYKDGRRVNIADYVQMALRTAATRSYLQGAAQRRKQLGIDTVLVSQYGACSETCLPWQGRVYIDDVWGDWHGERNGDYGLSNNGKWYPLLSVAVENGLFHPNCRHTVSTWIDGVSAIPASRSAEQIRRNAKLEQQQRALERKVRKAKRRLEGAQDPDTVKRYKREVKEAQAEIRQFIAEHDDVLRRDYWREKTYGVPDTRNAMRETPPTKEPGVSESLKPGVHFVGKIDKSIYSAVTNDIATDDVIITDERIAHIRERHPADFERYEKYLPEIIEQPDYILEANKPNTAILLREFSAVKEKFKLVLRIKIEGEPDEYKNSIISFWKIGDTTWKKTIKNKNILYKKE